MNCFCISNFAGYLSGAVSSNTTYCHRCHVSQLNKSKPSFVLCAASSLHMFCRSSSHEHAWAPARGARGALAPPGDLKMMLSSKTPPKFSLAPAALAINTLKFYLKPRNFATKHQNFNLGAQT